MKSILFFVLCLGLRNITGQPTKATAEEPKNAIIIPATVFYSRFAWKAMVSRGVLESGYQNIDHVRAECLKQFEPKDGDGDGIITHQEYAQSVAQKGEISRLAETWNTFLFNMFAILSTGKFDMIPIRKACNIPAIAMITDIPLAQNTEDAIKAFRIFYGYFDENKDGELSVTEVHYPMGLMKAMGLPYEDLFAKHMESVSISIEGNYFVIKYLCM